LDAPFQCASNAPTRVQTPTPDFFVNYHKFHNIRAKLSRYAKQHPSNSAHLMRRFCGVFRYKFTNLFIITTDVYKPDSRDVPRVGQMWLVEPHTQAFQIPPSMYCVPNGQVGPRPSPKPIALAYLKRALFIQTCARWAFTCLLSKYITRACVTSAILQQYIARHGTCTRYYFQSVLFHRKDVHRGYVATAI
jgi:hypothetical protein